MADYRPVPDERAPDFRRIARYAFEAGAGPHDPEEPLPERRRRMHSFGDERGMFAGDDLLAVCQHVPFTVRVRGNWLGMGGLTAVASPPEHRRQGLVGELLAASLAEYRERDWPLAALHPFDEAFYARYGWANGCRHHVATVDVDALSVAQDAAAGSFRRVHPGDAADELDPVFEAWLADRELATDRTADWWRDRVFQGHEAELYGYAWERDGEPRGYVVYTVDDDTLRTYEFAHADHEAYLNLLRFCHDHDSQVGAVELHGPDHRRLLDVLEDRGAVDLEVAASTMVRVVDVPAALSAVDYPVEEATVTVAVADPHAPWNDATFEVRVVDGAATVTESDGDAAVAETDGDATVAGSGGGPDAAVDVGTLTQLFVGYLGVDDARRFGGLAVADDAAADTLAALFPERETFVPEGF